MLIILFIFLILIFVIGFWLESFDGYCSNCKGKTFGECTKCVNCVYVNGICVDGDLAGDYQHPGINYIYGTVKSDNGVYPYPANHVDSKKYPWYPYFNSNYFTKLNESKSPVKIDKYSDKFDPPFYSFKGTDPLWEQDMKSLANYINEKGFDNIDGISGYGDFGKLPGLADLGGEYGMGDAFDNYRGYNMGTYSQIAYQQ